MAKQAPFAGRYDAFINVQGDEPVHRPQHVCPPPLLLSRTAAFSSGRRQPWPRASILDVPTVVKVVIGTDGRALYFSRAPIPYLRDPSDAPARIPLTLQHIGVYAYSRDALERWTTLPSHPLEEIERLEQLRPLAHGMTMGVGVVHEQRPETGIDTEDDLRRANERWSALAAEDLVWQ